MTVLTAMLTAFTEPHRHRKWEPDPQPVELLARSVALHGHRLVVLHDEPLDGPDWATWVQVDRVHPNPYFDRWRLFADYLQPWPQRRDGGEQTDQSVQWVVDATDVEMLHDPDPWADDVPLFVGSQLDRVGHRWMHDKHTSPDSAAWITGNAKRQLLNCGIVGGADLEPFIGEFAAELATGRFDRDITEMAAFNLVAYRHRWLTGEPCHTVFRTYDTGHPSAWWRHK